MQHCYGCTFFSSTSLTQTVIKLPMYLGFKNFLAVSKFKNKNAFISVSFIQTVLTTSDKLGYCQSTLPF